MNVVELIKQDEGLRLKPYRCTAGKLSIGYGRNLEDRGVSEEEAQDLLVSDISDCILSLSRNMGDSFTELSYVRQSVLVNMAYNLGLAGLMGFKKMLAAAEAGDFNQAAIEMLDSKWAQQVPNRAKRLAEMMRSGEWPEEVRYG